MPAIAAPLPVPAPAAPAKKGVEVFCVDPERAAYKGSVGARVLADVVWFDDGHSRAYKGALVKLDKFDAAALSEARQVELLDA